MKTILKNALLYRSDIKETGKWDLSIENGKIVQIEKNIIPDSDDHIMVLNGKIILPGFADVHVHLREPGFSHKETIRTGTLAAARGGYTTICAMPNLNPAPDCVENLAIEEKLIEEQAIIKVLPYGCITEGQKGSGKLVDFEKMKNRVAGFSDDGKGVQNDELMEEAMKRCAAAGKPIVAHCEIESLLEGGYIHKGKYAERHNHKGICSESEYLQVMRDIKLAEKTSCQYHVCHVSSKESVMAIRQAKISGLKVSGETAPHYLLLTDEDLKEEGRFKMNPPIRGHEDRKALMEAIADGTIECIATDHAPHTHEEKDKGLKDSAFGIVGLETAFPLLYTFLVKKNIISFEKLIELMSDNPRKIFGLGGGTKVGEDADITIMDLSEEYEINPDDFLSKGKSTPFTGMKVFGKTILTMVNGKIVYDSSFKKHN